MTEIKDNVTNENENINKKGVCAFCGRSVEKDHIYLYRAKHFSICAKCVEEFHMLNMAHNIKTDEHCEDEYDSLDYKVDFDQNIPTPHEIKSNLDQYIIGQDDAKMTIAVSVYNHYKRIKQKVSSDEVEIEKSNILLVGPTGCGKTLLAKTIAKQLNVPFTIADATVFTEAGYVGEDVESILSRLLQACDYDVNKAEMGIVYLDEVDKLGRKGDNPSITRDVNGEGVQQALLKMLEGTNVLVPPEGGRKHPEAKMISVNTSNILFICGGAFVGMENIIGSRMNTKPLGFNFELSAKKDIDKENIIKYCEQKDLKKYGFIPELIGRLPIITYVEKLDKETLKKILTEPKNSVIKQYVKLFEMDDIKLTFTDEAYDYIVNEAIETETGARGLRSIVERLLKKLMYDAPTDKPAEIVIDKTFIDNLNKEKAA